ncbi:MAG: DUF3305 domain-containing protein [Rhodospirillales bacterium]
MSARDTMPVGIVIERREIDSRWQQYTFLPVAVIPGAPAMEVTDEWRMLRQGEDWIHYHAGTIELELHSTATAGYRKNLINEIPYVFIVLTPGEEADEPDLMPLLATVCPDEAADYFEDSEQIVEGVPMPPELIAWVEDFVDKHHVEVEFKKRKRKPYDPRKEGFRGRNRRETRE